MRTQITTFIFLATSAFVNFSASANSLFSYIVYTSSGIQSKCGDYLGKTASGGRIELEDFLIHDPYHRNACALEGDTSIEMLRGRVIEGSGNLSCIATTLSLITHDTGYASHRKSFLDTTSLNRQLMEASQLATQLDTHPMVKVIPLDFSQSTIEITGSPRTLIILRSLDEVINFSGYGVKLAPGLEAKNILWHFPRAKKITITQSGVNPNDPNGRNAFGNNIGIPGTVLAPHAEVTFNNALITGALFAKYILSVPPKNRTCRESGVYAGQVNPACLESPIPGFGCNVIPLPPTPELPPKPPCQQQQQQC